MRMRILCVLGVAAIAFGLVFSASTPVRAGPDTPAPVTAKGKGNGVQGPYDTVEGTLTFHIRHTTDVNATYFAARVQVDSNLDGTFNGVGDSGHTTIHACGYDEAKNVDVEIDHKHYGGRIKIEVEGKGDWSVTVTQTPAPRHTIEGNVEGTLIKEGKVYPDISIFQEGVEVVCVDSKGAETKVKTDFVGDYTMKVFGYQDLAISTGQRPYKKVTKKVKEETFRFLGNPAWPIRLSFDLKLEKTAAIACVVRDKKTDGPIEGAQVTVTEASGRKAGSAATNKDGICGFDGLLPGKHTVTAQKDGYGDASVSVTTAATNTVPRTIIEMSGNVRAVREADLAVSGTAAPHRVLLLGERIKYEFRVSNEGREVASRAKFAVSFLGPKGGIFKAHSTLGTVKERMDDSGLDVDLGNVPVGAAATITAFFLPMKKGTITAAAKVTSAKDPKEGNNEAKVVTEMADTCVHGVVFTLERNQRLVLLQDVLVKLHVPGVTNPKATYTDSEGRYVFPGVAAAEYSLSCELKDKGNMLVLHSKKGFNDGVVILKTKSLKRQGKRSRTDLGFLATSADLDASLNAEKKGVLHEAAVCYYHLYDAVKYARENLKVQFNHQLPVDTYLHKPGKGAYYSPGNSHIGIRTQSASVRDANSPMNREYHEFGHHVNADADMSGTNSLPARTGTDKNHKGVFNSISTDSVLEGFAEFYACLVEGNPRYRWAYATVDFQANFHTFKKKDLLGRWVPFEEFNAASLLWDLYDKDNEIGRSANYKKYKDLVHMKLKDLWALLDNNNITSVRSLYTALSAKMGNKDSDKTDGVNDLDSLFILHRFFSDANENGKWDAGEAVGFADYFDSDVSLGNAARQNQPPIPGTAVAFSAKDDSGNDLDVGNFTVTVEFEGGVGDYTYETWPDPEAGNLRFYVPADCLRVVARPDLPGYSGEPLVLTPEPFWNAVVAAQEADSDVCLTEEFTLSPNDAAPPGTPAARPAGSTAIVVTWTIPDGADRVLVVRGIDHAPTTVSDGVLVYEGRDAEFSDTGLIPGLNYHYTVFAVFDEQVSAGAVASAATGLPTGDEYLAGDEELKDLEDVDEGGLSTLTILLLALLGLAILVVLVKRRGRF